MLYIFDLDGTLANIDHRLKHIEGDKKDWSAFYKACVYDQPNESVIGLLNALSDGGEHEFVIWTGRSEEVREETIQWFYDNTGLYLEEIEDILRMRPEGNFESGAKLKKQWLDEFREHRGDLNESGDICAIEDEEKVCQMWKENGVAVLRVL
jgi:hypothetical protein